MSADSQAGHVRPAGPNAVLCVKCEHLNDPKLETCERCGTHLYVLCSRCEHKNPRVLSRCEKCKHRLHKKLRDRVGGSRQRTVNLLYFVAAFGIIAGVAALIVWLADIPVPRLW